MKIERPDLSTVKTISPKLSGENRLDQKQFKSVLDDSMNQSPSPATSSTNTQSSMIASLSGIVPIPGFEKTEGVQRIEDFLDLIDAYIQKLEDHNYTLKDLAPFIDKMADKNENIAEFFNNLPDMDELKAIANEALIISSLEVEKFNRGDYLTDSFERR